MEKPARLLPVRKQHCGSASVWLDEESVHKHTQGLGKMNLERFCDFLSDPVRINASCEQVFREGRHSRVMVCRYEEAGAELRFVYKSFPRRAGGKGAVERIFSGKAERVFRAMRAYRQKGGKVLEALGAVTYAAGEIEGAVLTPYYADSMDLYHFVLRLCEFGEREKITIKREIGRQVAEIFYQLHRFGYYHRDAKAQNFLVRENGDGVNIYLLDVEGIRRRFLSGRRRAETGPARLASSLMFSAELTRTDGWRCVKSFAHHIGLDKPKTKEMFRRLAAQATAMRLVTMLKSIKPETTVHEL